MQLPCQESPRPSNEAHSDFMALPVYGLLNRLSNSCRTARNSARSVL